MPGEIEKWKVLNNEQKKLNKEFMINHEKLAETIQEFDTKFIKEAGNKPTHTNYWSGLPKKNIPSIRDDFSQYKDEHKKYVKEFKSIQLKKEVLEKEVKVPEGVAPPLYSTTKAGNMAPSKSEFLEHIQEITGNIERYKEEETALNDREGAIKQLEEDGSKLRGSKLPPVAGQRGTKQAIEVVPLGGVTGANQVGASGGAREVEIAKDGVLESGQEQYEELLKLKTRSDITRTYRSYRDYMSTMRKANVYINNHNKKKLEGISLDYFNSGDPQTSGDVLFSNEIKEPKLSGQEQSVISQERVNTAKPISPKPILALSTQVQPITNNEVDFEGSGAGSGANGVADIDAANGGQHQLRGAGRSSKKHFKVRAKTDEELEEGAYNADIDEELEEGAYNADIDPTPIADLESDFDANPINRPIAEQRERPYSDTVLLDELVPRESVENNYNPDLKMSGATIELEKRAKKLNIQQLKLAIKSFHDIYNDVIPELQTVTHQREKTKAMNSKDVNLVRKHFIDMEMLIKSYFASLGGDLSVGVIISAADFMNNYGGSVTSNRVTAQQKSEPTTAIDDDEIVEETVRENPAGGGQEGGGGRNAGRGTRYNSRGKDEPYYGPPPPSPDDAFGDGDYRRSLRDRQPSNTFGNNSNDRRRRLGSDERPSNHFTNSHKWDKHENKHIVSLKGANPYGDKNVERNILTRNGGVNQRYSKGLKGKILNAIQPSTQAGYINNPTLRQDVRQQTYVRQPVIQRNPDEFVING